MKLLANFYDNEPVREAVYNHLISTLEILAVEKVFSKEDVTGLYEAKEAITKGFEKLAEVYGKIEKIETKDTR